MERWSMIRSDQISRSVVSDSLRPHESQHARPPCPSPTPGVHWDSHPSSRWCHPAISSSVVPFSCPQSLPASEVRHILNPRIKPSISRCRRILYQLSHKGSPEYGSMPYFSVTVQWSVTILFLWTNKKLLFFQCILKQNLQVNERIIILLKLRPPVC